MADTGVVLLDSETGRAIVRKHCRKAGIPITELEDLVAEEIKQAGKLRKRGLFEEFDQILGRSEEQ